MATETVTLITAVVGAVCGVTGAVLGVINTCHQLQRNRVRLKVIPKHVIPLGALHTARLNFSVEVVNLSEFCVVVEDVGFLAGRGRHATLASIQGMEPHGKLPLRLEPRSSYEKVFWVDENTTDWGAVQCAYARTQCGTEATGTSDALKQLIQQGGTLG